MTRRNKATSSQMADGFFRLFVIILGRYIFQFTGAFVRFCWFRIRGNAVVFSEIWNPSTQSNGPINVEAFKNGLIGFGIIMAVVMILTLNP